MKKITPDISLFHIFSLGYVVETNHKDCFCKPIIKVLPLEYLSNENVTTMLYKVRQEYNDGTKDKDIVDLSKSEKVKLKVKKVVENSAKDIDWKKVNDQINIERKRWIPVTWLANTNYNEFNPPCVNRGDIVIIYKYGDMNSYFWDILFKRTLEEHKSGEGSFKRYIESDPIKKTIKKEITKGICTDDISFKLHCKDYTTNIFNYLEMENGEYRYFDQKGNMISVTQEGTIGLNATKDIVHHASSNLLYSCGVNMELAPSNMLSIITRDIIANASNGVNIKAGQSFVLKAATITLQGNVVINGDATIMGSVTPSSCPCCCVCPSGDGSGNNIPTPKPSKKYIPANKQMDSIYNVRNKNKDTFIKKIKTHVTYIIKTLADKVGLGS